MFGKPGFLRALWRSPSAALRFIRTSCFWSSTCSVQHHADVFSVQFFWMEPCCGSSEHFRAWERRLKVYFTSLSVNTSHLSRTTMWQNSHPLLLRITAAAGREPHRVQPAVLMGSGSAGVSHCVLLVCGSQQINPTPSASFPSCFILFFIQLPLKEINWKVFNIHLLNRDTIFYL